MLTHLIVAMPCRTSTIKVLKQAHEAAKLELEKAKTEAAAASTASTEKEARCVGLDRQVRTFEAEAADLNKQLTATVAAKDAADARSESLEKRLEEEHASMKEFRDKSGREMANKLEGVAKVEAQAAKLIEDKTNLTTQCDELKSQLEKALAGTELGAELIKMHDQQTSLEGQKSALTQELTELQLKIDKEAVQNVKDAADLKERQTAVVKLQHSLEREKVG